MPGDQRQNQPEPTEEDALRGPGRKHGTPDSGSNSGWCPKLEVWTTHLVVAEALGPVWAAVFVEAALAAAIDELRWALTGWLGAERFDR